MKSAYQITHMGVAQTQDSVSYSQRCTLFKPITMRRITVFTLSYNITSLIYNTSLLINSDQLTSTHYMLVTTQ